MKRLFAVICLFIWIPIPAMGGWFGPINYEECILKNMKGVTSDKAVLEIRKACRAKFPKKPIKKPIKKQKLRDVPKKVLENITGKAWFTDKAHPDASSIYNLYARLHNDNAKWTISKVEIRIFDKTTKTYEYILSHEPTSPPTGRPLTVADIEWDDEFPPLSPFKAEVFPFFAQKLPAGWEWTIVKAKGYRKP